MFPASARAQFVIQMPGSDPPKMRVRSIVLSFPSSLFSSRTYLLGLLGGLAGSGAAGLGGRSLLLGLLGAAEGAHTSDGFLADISAVAVLGGLAGDTLVDPTSHTLRSAPLLFYYLSGLMEAISDPSACRKDVE